MNQEKGLAILPKALCHCYNLMFSAFLGVFPFDDSGRISVKLSVYSIVTISAMFCNVYAFDRPHLFPKNLNLGWLVAEMLNLKNKLIVAAVCAHLVKLIQNRSAVSSFFEVSGLPEGVAPYVAVLAYHGVKIWLEEFLYESDPNLKWWSKLLKGAVANQPSLYLAVVMLQFCDWLNLSHRELCQMYALMKKQKVYNAAAIVDIHARVTQFLKVSNSVYGFQILSACLVFGELMIVNLLIFVIGYLKNGNWVELSEVALSASYDFAMLAYLSDCCQRCMDTANDFNTELFNLMKHNSANLYCNDKVLLYVKTRRSVNFTACGFFSLGYPFLTSVSILLGCGDKWFEIEVVAAVTTYLVILLQFSLTNE